MQKKRTKKTINKTSNGTSVGSFGSLNEGFIPTAEQSQEILDKFKSIINTRLDKLYSTKGADGELYAYGIAVNQVKKKAEQPEEAPTEEQPTEEPMDKETKLKEMIQAALSKPLSEKKAAQDEKKIELDEDLDLGHTDDEPHMIKGELYKIAQNALALYNMLKPFDKLDQEVDLPAWWQSKITKACTMLGSAKNYLEFELKEPQIDAMAGAVNEEENINENLKHAYYLAQNSKDVSEFKEKYYEKYKSKQDAKTDEFLEKIFNSVNKSSPTINERDLPAGEEKIVKGIKKSGDFKKDDPALYAIARSVYNKKKTKKKIKEAILVKLKDRK